MVSSKSKTGTGNDTTSLVKKQRDLIWIGTSNVVIPGNKSTFPPAYRMKSRLNYYSSLFRTVELNSTFYKSPLSKTYEKWSADVPANFRFSIKLSKNITHAKDLQADLSHVNTFLTGAEGIGTKKGCLLIQFPGKISIAHFNQVENILQTLQEHDPRNAWKKVVEFRNSEWYIGETWELLEEYGAAVVLHDIPKAKIFELHGNTNVVYIRFHGPKGDYRDSYPESFLRQTAKQVKQWVKEGKEVYAYFNNTMGEAVFNAIDLEKFYRET